MRQSRHQDVGKKARTAVRRLRDQEGGKADGSRDDWDRIEVERFFSLEKRCCGAGLIMARLSDTTLASIALSVLVANLFSTGTGAFFVFYLMDSAEAFPQCHFMEFSD